MGMIRIESLEEYINIVLKEFSKRKLNSLYEKPRVFFRGHNRDDYELLPSLARRITDKDELTFVRFEKEMIQDARLHNPDEFNKGRYPFSLLARMQHFGLPTRLLDITENALVALYFSCKGMYEHDGKIFCFQKEQKEVHSAYSLHVNLIASIAEKEAYTHTPIQDFWDEIKYDDYIPKKYLEKPFEKIEKKIIDSISTPLLVLPEMSTERQKRQQAAFIIYPNKIQNRGIEGNAINTSDLMAEKEIVVNNARKRKILEQLRLLGISEPFLFPETDKACSAIREHTVDLMDERLY